MGMETKWNKSADALLSALKGAGRIALLAHVSPDGDTMGSALALRLALLKLGKEAVVCCADPVPQMLMFMEGAETVTRPEALQGQAFDLAVGVDVADEGRMGAAQAVFRSAAATAQVDHHGTNPFYAQVNVVDGSVCATGILVYMLIKGLGAALDKQIAICLYTAISTDTGNFSFDNTTASAFAMMSELMAYDLPLNRLNRILFRQRSRAQLLLLARALSSLRFCGGDKIAAMQLTQADFDACGALPEHAEAMVNFGIDTVGVQMAFLCRETPQGDVKFSLRALPPCNVAKVAARFGGGGHALAAGCTLHMPIDEAAAQMVEALKEEL